MPPEDIDPNRQTARDTFHGKTLTYSQFDEAYAITSILAREIQKSGSFRAKLTDYAHAFARDQRFDALKGEEILRDVFKGRYGQTMNVQRRALLEREAQIKDTTQDQALHHAEAVLDRIKTEPQPFFQAYDGEAVAMSVKHSITENGAKSMMKDAHEAAHGRSLYEAGKVQETQFYTPVVEAERAQTRMNTRDQNRYAQSRA